MRCAVVISSGRMSRTHSSAVRRATRVVAFQGGDHPARTVVDGHGEGARALLRFLVDESIA